MPHMDTPCWVWTGAKKERDYGVFWMSGRSVVAYRVSWIFQYGDIAKDMCILHKCDNPPCVNPDHLFQGTRIDNVIDMDKKGRRGAASGKLNGSYTRPESVLRGESHPNSKLIESDVITIRHQWNKTPTKYGLQSKLAREFGVDRKLIARIVTREIWRHI